MSHKGKRLRSREKSIVMCVRGFFEKEKAQGKSILRDRVIDRTAAATGIGKTTTVYKKNLQRKSRGR